IGDEYAPPDWGGKGWHDLHVRLEGPAVADLRRYFFDSWAYASPDGPVTGPVHAPGHLAHPPRREGSETAAGRVQALVSGRFRDRRLIERHLQRAVALSRTRVFIQSAYFIPN